jgi:hypothetical protein
MIESHEERKQISSDKWNLNSDESFQKQTSISRQMNLQDQKKNTTRFCVTRRDEWFAISNKSKRLDYTKTFVSMIKSMNYKTMYVIITINDWKIEQMNVKTIFLYDKIHENVFVVQFTRFEQEINKICKLNKTLYDFKQFSRVWFEMLIKFLFSFDYVSLNVEFNVFMKNDIIIVIYVNDLIFTKFDSTIIFWLKNALNERFEMSDLNSCIYYLDMMIFRIRRFRLLFLNQSVYVEQMLRNHEMWNCKSLIIFMNVLCRLIKIFDEYTVDKSFRINY